MHQYVTRTWSINVPGTSSIMLAEKERIVGIYVPPPGGGDMIYVVCCQEVPPSGYLPPPSRYWNIHATAQGVQFSSVAPVQYLGTVPRYGTNYQIFVELTDL